MKQPIGFIKTYPNIIVKPGSLTTDQQLQQNNVMIILSGPVIGCNHEENEDDD